MGSAKHLLTLRISVWSCTMSVTALELLMNRMCQLISSYTLLWVTELGITPPEFQLTHITWRKSLLFTIWWNSRSIGMVLKKQGSESDSNQCETSSNPGKPNGSNSRSVQRFATPKSWHKVLWVLLRLWWFRWLWQILSQLGTDH